MLLSQAKAKAFSEAIRPKIVDPNQITAFCDAIRNKGKSIVTLNGSFDLLHPGHLEMIYQASLQGDLLFLLLNSDASIQKYKNPKRPIHPLQIRLQMIAALEMVDYATWFEETDPIAILDKIRPDVHVNGSDYGENCIEADIVKRHGGRIHIVNLVEGYSSSRIIEKIKDVYG